MTPEELEKLPKELEKTMTELEVSIMGEIIDRLRDVLAITPTIDWMMNRLDFIGTSRDTIRQKIKQSLNLSEKQIDTLYRKAIQSDSVRNAEIYRAVGRDYLPYSENEWLQHVTEAVRRQTKDSLREMQNITQSSGFNVRVGKEKVFTPLSEYLEQSLDKAMMGIATGMKTYDQAIGDVIDEMTDSGVRMVDYASGRIDRIEVAARRAVMTGVAQLTDKVNEKNAEELQTDYWEVDWHMGARNTGTGYLNHQGWQGRVYSSEEMCTICGLGEMLGFAGINCYHIRFPFIPGISKRKYTDEWLDEQNRKENEKKVFRGKEFDTYGALQYQRKLERTIRKQKQDVVLLERANVDEESLMQAKGRLRNTEKTYVEFSKAMGLPQQRERFRIPRALPKAELGAGSSGSPPSGEPVFLGEIDPLYLDEAVRYYNERIRDEAVEHAFIIDRNGNVYYSVGNESGVSFDGVDLDGATVTHNHPESNGIVSFGRDDFEFMKAHQNIRELHCVNSEYNYKVSLLKDITDVVYNDLYLEGFKYAMEADYESQDAAMRVLHERGYVRYERTKFDTGSEG